MIELIQGDCLEKMKNLEVSSIDMVLADPPYGVTERAWDKVIPIKPMWEQLKRVIKEEGAIVLTAMQPFTSKLIVSNLEMFRYCWVWDKHIPRGMHQAKHQPMRKHEDVVVFSKNYPNMNYFPIMTKRDKPVTVKNYKRKQFGNTVGLYKDNTKTYVYTHKNPNSIIQGCWEANKGKKTPTQKPTVLMEYLIKTYTKEGDTVLDFCMGGGASGIACENLNRNFIGIELVEEFFKIAQERINQKGKHERSQFV